MNQYAFFEHSTRANPWPVYAQMRQQAPIWRGISRYDNVVWVFTRYDDVVEVLKDHTHFIKDARRLPVHFTELYLGTDGNSIFNAVNFHLLNLDQPDHTRLRNLVHKAFTTRVIRQLEPRIHAITHDLLEAMDGQGVMNLMDAFAFPLPVTVIAELLGVHADMRDKFREWTRQLLFGTDEIETQLAAMEFVGYVNELIEERQSTHKGDMLSELVSVREAGDQLNHLELLSMVFLLLVAGHETTVNLIGNGTLALLQNPEQKRKLQENPALIRTAIEEMLRYNGPVETPTLRYALEDITYKGHHIQQGDVILPSLLAANHDPAIFSNPDTFDITRDPNPHVAFGYGIHYCIGAPLARLEAAIALPALLARFPNLQLATEVDSLEWNDSLLIHGLKELPVTG